MEHQTGQGSLPYMPPPPDPADRLAGPPPPLSPPPYPGPPPPGGPVGEAHPLRGTDGANWWDDPEGVAPMVQRPAEMRVLPDGSVVYEEVVEEPEDQGRERSPMLIAAVIGSLLLLLLAVGIGWLLAVRVNGGLDPQRRRAVGACHQYVQVRINAKTPSTMTTDYTEGDGYGPWQIQGTVDGTNGDGAPVKARYDCIVDANADHNLWRLQKLDLI